MTMLLSPEVIQPRWVKAPDVVAEWFGADVSHSGIRGVSAGKSSKSIVLLSCAHIPSGTDYFSQLDTEDFSPSVRVESEVSVSGERFSVEREDDLVFLVHQDWSLIGEGETVADALKNLMEEAKMLAEDLQNEPFELLSESASRMRDFVLRIS